MNIVHGVAPERVLELRQSVESKEVYLAFKRLFDLSFSLLLIILFLPLMAVVCIIIKLASPGPAVFKQIRVGLFGEEFIMYKFRTMYVGDHNALENFVSEDQLKQCMYKKAENDPRITPFGRYLRKTSIDELPQLFNILIGDMSLIGPRPMVQFYFSSYPMEKEMRSVVKPGLTGYWQIINRGNTTTILDMIDYDMEYIDNLSLYLDLKILLLTIPTVLKCEGAV